MGKALLLLVLAALILPVASDAGASEKPNVLFILLDDAREDDVDGMPLTNTLLKDEGVAFANYYTTFPLCCPSRATTFTGLYQHNHGVGNNKNGFQTFQSLGHEENSVIPLLHDAGYRTGMFGKYLNNYDVPSHVPVGWDEWNALLYTDDDGGAEYYGYDLSENGTKVHYGHHESDYLTDVLSDKTDEFIRSSDEPFFAYVGTSAPHIQLTPALRHHNVVGDKRIRTLLSVDEMVARFVNTLSETGKLDNTYIIFTSDNGWMQGEHGISKEKRTYYEESASVPLLVRGPGVGKGIVSEKLVGNTDLAPTFAAIGGQEMPADGRSFLPLLSTGETEGWRKNLLLENPTHSRGPYKGIVTERYKYIDIRGQKRLYDLDLDPTEHFNIARTVDPLLAADLETKLGALRECAGDCSVAEDT